MSTSEEPLTEEWITQAEAARRCDVSYRTVVKWVKLGKIEFRVFEDGRKRIPQRAVLKFLHEREVKKHRRPRVRYEHIDRLDIRLRTVEEAVKTVQLAVGAKKKKFRRTSLEIQILHREVLAMLDLHTWPNTMISEFAETVSSLHEDDVVNLLDLSDTGAMTHFFDLTKLMKADIRSRDTWPSPSLEYLYDRVTDAEDRTYGLLFSATSIQMDYDRERAFHAVLAMKSRGSQFSDFVARYVLRRMQLPAE